MKSIRSLFTALFFLIAGLPFYSNAQTLTVTTNNESWATLAGSVTCSPCTINIPAGWTLLLNSNGACSGCTFNGGTVKITSGFTFNNTTTFNNDTLLINTSTNPNNFVFNSDSVAINAALSNQNGTALISNSRLSVNANLNFNSATLTNDSIRLNSNMNFSNAPGDFSGCHVTLANNAKISTQASTFTNSVFAIANGSGINISNATTADGSSFYMHGNATFHASSVTLKNNSNVVMDGSNSFKSDNALTLQNSNITMSGTSALTASSLTATGSTLTASDNTNVTISNALNLTGTTVTMNNSAAFKSSSVTVGTNSNLTMNGSATLKVDNAFNVAGSTVAINGSSNVKANSSTVQSSSTLTMGGSSSLSLNNGFDVSASNVFLNGNSAVSANNVTLENTSELSVGDGTLASTAHLSSNNTATVADHSLLKISNGNNYFFTNANNFTGGSTGFPIKTNTISCNTSPAMHTYANSCATGYVYGCATLNSGGGLACTILAIATPDLSVVLGGTDAVTLSWSAGDKSTADHFLVERSLNGLDWTTIGTVTADRYFTGEYQFSDPAAQAGTDYYRLQVIDKDERSIYSKIGSVTIDYVPGAISIYPNPATGHTFSIRTASADPILVNIFNLSGQLLLRTSLKGQTVYPVKLPASVTSGNYLVVQVISREKIQAFNLLNQ